ncbi:WbqC family protein [Maridesulfovibrio ferrireducens]|uniref:WbqC family protein n=1 Tax=Maridesulfovibrio ferrireducens TaxID=246191 RepID=UPI001A1C4518|nr:WbqC family protein [Maridesulfovibrio ferrireducens]MBI9112691.1 WbqC family protein [Maridesulfovibrio ferrireducens]
MICAIMQPTYLSWVGYFDLIDQVDTFVFFDNVIFDKRSWQQRNRILTPRGLEFLTIPISSKGAYKQLINETKIESAHFVQKHLRTIKNNYSKAAYYNDFYDEFCIVMKDLSQSLSLSELNIGLIKWFCTKFGITTNFITSSKLNTTGNRSKLLVDILNKVKSNEYITPPGSINYIVEDKEIFDSNSINVYVQNYVPYEYRQTVSGFTPYASALDLLLNAGPDCLKIIRQGRSPNTALEEYCQEKNTTN